MLGFLKAFCMQCTRPFSLFSHMGRLKVFVTKRVFLGLSVHGKKICQLIRANNPWIQPVFVSCIGLHLVWTLISRIIVAARNGQLHAHRSHNWYVRRHVKHLEASLVHHCKLVVTDNQLCPVTGLSYPESWCSHSSIILQYPGSSCQLISEFLACWYDLRQYKSGRGPHTVPTLY